MLSNFSHSAGGIVLNPKGEVLVVKQRNGSWSLPKGGIQEGEDPRTAAVREIAEESGITDVQMVKLLSSYSRHSLDASGGENTGTLKRITMYFFTTTMTEINIHDPRILDAKWVKIPEVERMLTHPRDQEFFRAAVKEL